MVDDMSLQRLLVDCRKGVTFIRSAGIYDEVLPSLASGWDDKRIEPEPGNQPAYLLASLHIVSEQLCCPGSDSIEVRQKRWEIRYGCERDFNFVARFTEISLNRPRLTRKAVFDLGDAHRRFKAGVNSCNVRRVPPRALRVFSVWRVVI